MDSQDKIVASVRELLGEIQKLKAEKDDAPDNPVKANYLQCEIFRKFAVIKSLMASSQDEMEAIEEEVVLKKKQVGTEDEDLKRMSVPKLLRAKALLEWTKKEEEAFPYLHLPPEVRRIILGYLTTPLDKLNLVKVVPSDGHMMGWQRGDLQLELVLSIILETELPQGTYEILVNLCHASDNLHGVVKNLMERCVEYEDPNSLHANYDFLNYTTKKITQVIAADLALNPFPATIRMDFDIDSNSASSLHQLGILRETGTNIWSATLYILKMPVLQAIQVLRDCLELMPNLRRLETFIRLAPSPRTLDRNQIVETFRAVQLPELPHLKYLSVKGYNMKPVAAKLLRKYQSTLVFLKTDKFSMTSPRGRQLYPRLRVLDVADVQQPNSQMVVSRLKPFVGSALKSIRIWVGYEYNRPSYFKSLMCALSPFRDTVEDLFVEFSTEEPIRWGSTGMDGIDQMNFPKVRTLCVRNYPGSWNMLLHFPAVEQLTLHLDEPRHNSINNLYDAVSLSEIVKLSCDEEEMYSSNIWKLLPFLDKISIQKDWIGFRVLEVTRSDCLAYQERLNRVMEEMGQVDTVIWKSVRDDIMQSDDTGIIINATVCRNIVQEGNGRIFVDGRVIGNIEQKGDGKIFIRGKHKGTLVKSGNGIVVINWGNVKNEVHWGNMD